MLHSTFGAKLTLRPSYIRTWFAKPLDLSSFLSYLALHTYISNFRVFNYLWNEFKKLHEVLHSTFGAKMTPGDMWTNTTYIDISAIELFLELILKSKTMVLYYTCGAKMTIIP